MARIVFKISFVFATGIVTEQVQSNGLPDPESYLQATAPNPEIDPTEDEPVGLWTRKRLGYFETERGQAKECEDGAAT